MRLAVCLLLATGCDFALDGTLPAGPDAGSGSSAPDGSVEPRRACDPTDSSLKLCLDFDDAADFMANGSNVQLQVTATSVLPATREDESAALLSGTSRLHVGESPELDIEDNLTFSMWVRIAPTDLPMLTDGAWLLDNNQQYYASVRGTGRVRCGAAGEYTDSLAPIADGMWHHVACTYDPDSTRVYIDGHLANCNDTEDREIPKIGTSGLAIGANISGAGATTTYMEQFTGGIDNVQVFSRTWSGPDLCTAVHGPGTTCNQACPGD